MERQDTDITVRRRFLLSDIIVLVVAAALMAPANRAVFWEERNAQVISECSLHDAGILGDTSSTRRQSALAPPPGEPIMNVCPNDGVLLQFLDGALNAGDDVPVLAHVEDLSTTPTDHGRRPPGPKDGCLRRKDGCLRRLAPSPSHRPHPNRGGARVKVGSE
jgi:hypothetical protein